MGAGVPQETLGHLLVAMGDGHTSDEDKQLLLRYCHPEQLHSQHTTAHTKHTQADMLILCFGVAQVLPG